jgi:hypothetical protein
MPPQPPSPCDYAITANFAEIQEQCDLTIDSTAGGSVTEPGEGTFTYDGGTRVMCTPLTMSMPP